MPGIYSVGGATVRSIKRIPMAACAHAALCEVTQGVDVEAVLAVGLETSDLSSHAESGGRFGISRLRLKKDNGSAYTRIFGIGRRWAYERQINGRGLSLNC